MEKKDKAIKYYLQGMTMTAIAAEIGVTRQTVSKYIQAYETIQKQIQLTQNTLEKEQEAFIRQDYNPDEISEFDLGGCNTCH